MPTTANPFLLLLGISPGAAQEKTDPTKLGKYDYSPTVGKSHPFFYSNGEDGNTHWKKVTLLCTAVLQKLDERFSKDQCTCLSGHLNLGTAQEGNGSSPNAIDPEIAEWIPAVIGGSLRPEVLILLGLKGKLKELKPVWTDGPLDFVFSTKDEIRLKYSGTRRYHFNLWRNPDSTAKPRIVVGLPNHPSRHPFSSFPVWTSACHQISRVIRKELSS